jgi:hypothetical protein
LCTLPAFRLGSTIALPSGAAMRNINAHRDRMAYLACPGPIGTTFPRAELPPQT